RWGIEQTEIDAMATLRPELLRRIAVDAVGPYFDSTLTARSWAARNRWQQQAQEALSEAIDRERYDRLTSELRLHLHRLRSKVDEIDALMPDVADLDLPELDEVTPEVADEGFMVDSRWSFLEQVRALKAHKIDDDEE